MRFRRGLATLTEGGGGGLWKLKAIVSHSFCKTRRAPSVEHPERLATKSRDGSLRRTISARAISRQVAVTTAMRGLWWWWGAAGLLSLLLGEARSKYAPLPDINNRTFIKQYVDIHNKFRSEVKPSASNMLYMTFDLALARIARAWANKCVWKHNPNQRYHPDRMLKPTGENMWMGSASGHPINVENAIRAFHSEVNFYTFSTHHCTKVCGHYTQVVWATSHKVGCAIVYCRYMSGEEKNNNILVCNYGPAGNYRGVRPYKEGKPCSNCPKGDTCKENLCRNSEREKENSLRYSRWYPPFERRIICDPSCIAVVVLRPLLMLIAFAVVYCLQIYYPGLSFSK